MRRFEIGIGGVSLREMAEQFTETVRAVQRGERPPRREGLYFEDLATLLRTFTAEKKAVGLAELRRRPRAYLGRAQKGPVLVTVRGEPVAILLGIRSWGPKEERKRQPKHPQPTTRRSLSGKESRQ